MKKITIALTVLLILSMASSSFAVAGTDAAAPKFGMGAFGGIEFPIVQLDQGKGTNFGAKGILKVLPFIILEPNLTFVQYGSPDLGLEGVTNDLDGSKLTSYGVDAILGSGGGGIGISPYLFGGVGFFKTTRDQTDTFSDTGSKFGYTAGLGINIGLSSMLSLDGRGRFSIVPFESGSSKKSLSLLVGVNYYFGAM